jgi:hypothetical protein
MRLTVGLFDFFESLVAKAFDETRDDSACLVASYKSPQGDPFSNQTSIRKARYRLNTPKKNSHAKLGQTRRYENPKQ